jgi:hypothetical protein
MLLCECHEHWVLEILLPSDNRAVGLNDNVVLTTVVDDRALLAERVELGGFFRAG